MRTSLLSFLIHGCAFQNNILWQIFRAPMGKMTGANRQCVYSCVRNVWPDMRKLARGRAEKVSLPQPVKTPEIGNIFRFYFLQQEETHDGRIRVHFSANHFLTQDNSSMNVSSNFPINLKQSGHEKMNT